MRTVSALALSLGLPAGLLACARDDTRAAGHRAVDRHRPNTLSIAAARPVAPIAAPAVPVAPTAGGPAGHPDVELPSSDAADDAADPRELMADRATPRL